MPNTGAVPDIVAGFLEGAFGQPQRDARIEAALGVEGVQQLAKAVVANDEILQRQFAIVELDLVQVFAAHGVVGPGHLETRRVRLQQNAADALAAGLAVDPREDDEHAGLPGPADQRLGAVENDAVALDDGVGPVVRHIGAGVRLGHADRQHAFAGDDLRQNSRANGFRRVGRDHAGLHAGLAEGRHRGHVAGLGNLLEHQRGIEYRQTKAAIFLGHRHAEHADLGELLHVVPGERAVHVFWRVGLELALSEFSHRGDHPPLLFGELEVHCLSLT